MELPSNFDSLPAEEQRAAIIEVNRRQLTALRNNQITDDEYLQAKADREMFLLALSTTDRLTGLLNRNGFVQAVGRRLSEAKRNEVPEGVARRMALFLYDVDYFKRINDTFGHGIGDKVLGEYAKLLRDGDIRGRWGGDEFAGFVTLPDINITNVDPNNTDQYIRKAARNEAIQIADRLRRDIPLKVSSIITNLDWEQTLSVGVYVVDQPIAPGQMVNFADMAMMHAKQERNATVLWRRGMKMPEKPAESGRADQPK